MRKNNPQNPIFGFGIILFERHRGDIEKTLHFLHRGVQYRMNVRRAALRETLHRLYIFYIFYIDIGAPMTSGAPISVSPDIFPRKKN